MKKNNSASESYSIKKKIVNVSGVPSEVILGVPIVTVTGNQEFMINNYRGIMEYNDSFIRIQTKTGQIKVNGRNLTVDYYTNDEMKVIGHIKTIEYE